MPTREKILTNLPEFRFPWDVSPIYVLEPHAKAIAWNSITRLPFLVTSKVGKGRLVIFASWNYSIEKDEEDAYRDLYRRLVAWVSRCKDPATLKDYHDVCRPLSNCLSELRSSASGTFYQFDHDSVRLIPDEVNALIEAMLDGRVNLILSLDAITRGGGYWAPLVKMAGLAIPPVVNYCSANDVELEDVLTKPILSLQEVLENLWLVEGDEHEMSSFHDFLEYQGPHALNALDHLCHGAHGDSSSMHFEFNQKLSQTLKERLLDLVRKDLDRIKEYTPTPERPLSDPEQKKWCQRYNQLLNCGVLFLDSPGRMKAPQVHEYPGDLTLNDDEVVFQTVILQIRPNGCEDEIHPTGYYLPAGRTLEVEWLESKGTETTFEDYGEQWSLEVGCWSDISLRLDTWTHFPAIQTCYPLTPRSSPLRVHSAFGGSVQIRNGKGNSACIEVKLRLKGVVEAPYLSLRDPKTFTDWEERRVRAPAPWADLVGDAVSFCLPSSYVRQLSLEDALYMVREVWDRVVKMDRDMVSCNSTSLRRERVVLDTMPSCGYAHSGYPIVAQDDENFAHCIVRREYAFEHGAWGLCHEIGHQMQEDSFTWDETTEVTVNIFTLYNRDIIFHLPMFGDDLERFESALKYLDTAESPSPKYENWAEDPFCALTIYAQLAKHFGWGVVRKWLHSYRSEPMACKELGEPQAVRDNWLRRFSQAAGCNVAPLFAFWAIPVSTEAEQAVHNLPPFLPWDWVTQLDATRYHDIRIKYGILQEDSWKTILDTVRQRDDLEIPPISLEVSQENDVLVCHVSPCK